MESVRHVLRGTISSSAYDLNATDTSCRSNRGERLYNFFGAFPPDVGDTADYVGGDWPQWYTDGTNSGWSESAFVSPQLSYDSGSLRSHTGSFDNFNGNGSRHASTGERGPSHRPGQAATYP